ncbi:hypothetical protein CHLRE_01g049117v5 [Chlamydomonas reinhardtii]|uniref:Uncharacterized protein n=1 Tax=Chlamydomonas reinhardtii TaxID=3055 RepID=A0A2K3E7X4_CHLRE|nr:uncharacterized protein CHLRE_01g049117v5 [Chlamydomonas reinhardtii]PNW88886.1 hypothetical protein CHLRE_01g049117v5 [Chlamydomonas reinhardtii]
MQPRLYPAWRQQPGVMRPHGSPPPRHPANLSIVAIACNAGGPPVCPRCLVPQLLEVAARANAELLWALWAKPF